MSKKAKTTKTTKELLDEVTRVLKNTDAITVLVRRDSLKLIHEELARLVDLEK
jgi:F420-dependent methylenetetrahydromethanopterin dehydrogenase